MSTKEVNEFSKSQVIQNIFSDHVGMKLEIKDRRKTGKSTKGWNSKHIFKQHISQKENTLKTNENENKKQHNKI